MAPSAIVTPLFNANLDSILLPMLLRWQLDNPASPDARPQDTRFVFRAAAVVVLLNRPTMFGREGAIVSLVAAPGIGRDGCAEGL